MSGTSDQCTQRAPGPVPLRDPCARTLRQERRDGQRDPHHDHAHDPAERGQAVHPEDAHRHPVALADGGLEPRRQHGRRVRRRRWWRSDRDRNVEVGLGRDHLRPGDLELGIPVAGHHERVRNAVDAGTLRLGDRPRDQRHDVRARHLRPQLHVGARDRIAAVEVVQPNDDRAVEAVTARLRGDARLGFPVFMRNGRPRPESGENQGGDKDGKTANQAQNDSPTGLRQNGPVGFRPRPPARAR